MSLAVFLFLFVAIILGDEYNNCQWTFQDNNGINVTYDLSDFHFTNKAFRVTDEESQTRGINGFIYEFNICGQLPQSIWDDSGTIISDCHDTNGQSPCTAWNNATGDCISWYNVTTNPTIPSAVQMEDYNSTTPNRCFWLGLDTNNATIDYRVSLYDKNDSSRGIKYLFRDGSYSPATKTNRRLRVDFLCPDDASYFFDPSAELDIDESVIEYPATVYTLSITSPLACPAKCIAKYNNQYAVCSGKGICATDPIKKEVRCLCDDGYTGEVCDIPTTDTLVVTSSDTGLVTVIVICLIILGVMVVLSAYLCHKIRLQQKSMDDVQGAYFEPILLDSDQPSNVASGGVSMNINTKTAPVDVPPPVPKESL